MSTNTHAAVSGATGLTRRIYLYSFLDDLVPLYPLYALLFADNGLTVPEISSLFVIWSLSSVLLEVPSGALADATSRRALLVAAPLLTAVAYAGWTFFPSYPVFALGFVLWGAKGALRSGAFEALVYEELRHRGAADRYGAVIGRAQVANVAAILVCTALAVPVYATGGFVALGVLSVVGRLACAAVALGLPERRDAGGSGAGGAVAEYLSTLRAGLGEVRADRSVRRAVLLIPAVSVVWGGLDEYLPLLAGDVTDSAWLVTPLVLLVVAGTAVGGMLGAYGGRLGHRGLAVLIAVAAPAFGLGALIGHPAGFLAIAVAAVAFQLANVAADVRLQHAVTGPARATVTSVAGLGQDVVGIGYFVAYGFFAERVGHPAAFGASAGLYAVVVALLVGWRASDARKATRAS